MTCLAPAPAITGYGTSEAVSGVTTAMLLRDPETAVGRTDTFPNWCRLTHKSADNAS
jgi:hypothetical protein